MHIKQLSAAMMVGFAAPHVVADTVLMICSDGLAWATVVEVYGGGDGSVRYAAYGGGLPTSGSTLIGTPVNKWNQIFNICLQS